MRRRTTRRERTPRRPERESRFPKQGRLSKKESSPKPALRKLRASLGRSPAEGQGAYSRVSGHSEPSAAPRAQAAPGSPRVAQKVSKRGPRSPRRWRSGGGRKAGLLFALSATRRPGGGGYITPPEKLLESCKGGGGKSALPLRLCSKKWGPRPEQRSSLPTSCCSLPALRGPIESPVPRRTDVALSPFPSHVLQVLAAVRHEKRRVS